MEVINRINTYILNPLILLMFSVAGIVFLWGIVVFIARADSEEGRATGKRAMIWGLVGFLVMFGVWGVVSILLDTINTI